MFLPYLSMPIILTTSSHDPPPPRPPLSPLLLTKTSPTIIVTNYLLPTNLHNNLQFTLITQDSVFHLQGPTVHPSSRLVKSSITYNSLH